VEEEEEEDDDIFTVSPTCFGAPHTIVSENLFVLCFYAAVVNGYYSGCVLKYKRYSFAFTEIQTIYTTVNIASVALLCCVIKV
jgi:hypothetical protein